MNSPLRYSPLRNRIWRPTAQCQTVGDEAAAGILARCIVEVDRLDAGGEATEIHRPDILAYPESRDMADSVEKNGLSKNAGRSPGWKKPSSGVSASHASNPLRVPRLHAPRHCETAVRGTFRSYRVRRLALIRMAAGRQAARAARQTLGGRTASASTTTASTSGMPASSRCGRKPGPAHPPRTSERPLARSCEVRRRELSSCRRAACSNRIGTRPPTDATATSASISMLTARGTTGRPVKSGSRSETSLAYRQCWRRKAWRRTSRSHSATNPFASCDTMRSRKG